MNVTTTLTTLCGGANHATFTIVRSGKPNAVVTMLVQDMKGSISDEEIAAFLKVLVRLTAEDKTIAQTRTAFQAGVVLAL